MAILPIYTFDHAVLKRKTKHVDDMDDALSELIDNMFATMDNADGVGLAANQIGVSKSLFVVDVSHVDEDEDEAQTPEERKKLKEAARAEQEKNAKDGDSKDQADSKDDSEPEKLVLINPVIVDLNGDEVDFLEGCLSLPDLTGTVIRPEQITVKYFDRDMNEQELTTDGLLARVIQHEIDHLHGIYFFERMTPIRRARLHNKIKRIRKGLTPAAYPLFQDGKKKRII